MDPEWLAAVFGSFALLGSPWIDDKGTDALGRSWHKRAGGSYALAQSDMGIRVERGRFVGALGPSPYPYSLQIGYRHRKARHTFWFGPAAALLSGPSSLNYRPTRPISWGAFAGWRRALGTKQWVETSVSFGVVDRFLTGDRIWWRQTQNIATVSATGVWVWVPVRTFALSAGPTAWLSRTRWTYDTWNWDARTGSFRPGWNWYSSGRTFSLWAGAEIRLSLGWFDR